MVWCGTVGFDRSVAQGQRTCLGHRGSQVRFLPLRAFVCRYRVMEQYSVSWWIVAIALFLGSAFGSYHLAMWLRWLSAQ